jgi:hypothetical protein
MIETKHEARNGSEDTSTLMKGKQTRGRVRYRCRDASVASRGAEAQKLKLSA